MMHQRSSFWGGMPRTSLLIALIAFTLSSAFPRQARFWQNPLPTGNNLRGVHAVSANLVIAVGDVGTILKTSNGGASWSIRLSGTAANLNGVWFADDKRGYAVGDSESSSGARTPAKLGTDKRAARMPRSML